VLLAERVRRGGDAQAEAVGLVIDVAARSAHTGARGAAAVALADALLTVPGIAEMSDAAALRAKANEMDKEEKLRIAMDAAPWPEKMLPTRDEQVQPFVWPWGAQNLIAELELVRRILAMVKGLPMGGETLHFHDSFIESDAMRVELADRMYIIFNTKCKRHAAERISSSGWAARFNERMTTMYAMHESSLLTCEEHLLRMQALYEDLKPQTRELIKTCSSETQLRRSMLTMRESPTPKKRRLFKTPVRNEDDTDSTSPQPDTEALTDRFAVVEKHISHLQGVLDDVAKVLIARTQPSPRASDARLDFVGQL
jgi:hypothetical protein